MNLNLEHLQQTQYTKLAQSSSFHRSVYLEIEEIGWEHLLSLDEGLTYLRFRILDKQGRVHLLEIHLNELYPKCPPSISADVPYIFNLKWSRYSRLKDVLLQFREHLQTLQEFWYTMDDIDKSLWVVDPKQLSRAASHRLVNIGNDCFIMLQLNASDPRSLPECRLMGPDSAVNSLSKAWRRNSKRWMKERLPSVNLANVLEIQLPRGPLHVQTMNQEVECGICYAQFLPIDDELGAKSGSGTDYTCENSNCSSVFHSICLGDWLRSITTTRQSFDVLFGNCPYCSEPVAIKISIYK